MFRTTLLALILAALIVPVAHAQSYDPPTVAHVEAVPPASFLVTVACNDCPQYVRVELIPIGRWRNPAGHHRPTTEEVEMVMSPGVTGATVTVRNSLTVSHVPALIDVWWGTETGLDGTFFVDGSSRCAYVGTHSCQWGTRCLNRDADGVCTEEVDRCVLAGASPALDQWCVETALRSCALGFDRCP